jgi:hypothetical protein
LGGWKIQEGNVKKPWLAFLLNFLVAGAGFAYLGKWKWAAINFVAAFAAGIIIALYFPDAMSIAAPLVAAIDGSIAMSAAREMNAKSKLQAAQAGGSGVQDLSGK